MILAGRNQVGLTEHEIARCVEAWEVLCGDRVRELVVEQAREHSSHTRFNEADGKVYLGADVLPGAGYFANSRMSYRACLAHELAHAERFESGYQRPCELPDNLIDEAETSLRASFQPTLSLRDREDLIDDARERLNLWFAFQQEARQGGIE